MSLIVQKFGGSSVNTFEKREMAISKITSAKDKGHDVVIVVSAMGRMGEPYATDTLIKLLNDITLNPKNKLKDLIMSCGEIISAAIMAQSLEDKGYPAEVMTGIQAGIKTDDNFSSAEILEINSDRIKRCLEKGKIVVVAGFQGYTHNLETTTLGRGGSDTSAIALGGALKADIVEIYTDVSGIALADPRLISDAPILEHIEFAPMYILSSAGAKIIHPRAVKTAMEYKMPFVVRSTFDNFPGTIVGFKGSAVKGLYGIALTKNVYILKSKYEGLVRSMENNIVNKLFFTQVNGEYSLAIHGGFNLPKLNNSNLFVSDGCDIITLAWDSSRLDSDRIEEYLSNGNIAHQGYFPLEKGGAWAVPSELSSKCIRHLYDSLVRDQELAV
ncbi:MAG: aspartate kinase [Bacillota bacterium]